MKTIQTLLLGILLTGSLCFLSCKKDEDPQGCNYGAELQDEQEAISTALTAYSANPTPANCQAFKDAYQNWIDAAETYFDCASTAGTGAQLQAELDAIQASLDQLTC